MPTASEFRAASTMLRTNADTVLGSGGMLREMRNNTGVLGGPYVATVDTALVVSTANVHRLSIEMHAVAMVLDARATICEQYTAAMRQYRMLKSQWDRSYLAYHDATAVGQFASYPGSQPILPLKPAPWVEEG